MKQSSQHELEVSYQILEQQSSIFLASQKTNSLSLSPSLFFFFKILELYYFG